MLQPASAFRLSDKGTSAVEFAMILPMLMLILFGIIGYGYVFGVYHGLQQIASEAARASVSGLNDSEREALARDFVSANASAYVLLDPAKLRVRTSQSGPTLQSFEIAISYDMSGTVFDQVASLVALPPPLVERRAIVQRGGY